MVNGFKMVRFWSCILEKSPKIKLIFGAKIFEQVLKKIDKITKNLPKPSKYKYWEDVFSVFLFNFLFLKILAQKA